MKEHSKGSKKYQKLKYFYGLENWIILAILSTVIPSYFYFKVVQQMGGTSPHMAAISFR